MREKCSRVMLSREASTPLLVASAISIGAFGGASSGASRNRYPITRWVPLRSV